jgi:AAA+ ATPase superfamily predicted ATPase
MEKMKGETSFLKNEIENLKQEIKSKDEEMIELKDELQKIPHVKDLSDVVVRLHTESDTKEAKVVALRKVVQKVIEIN